MPARTWDEDSRAARLQELDGKQVQFYVPWSDAKRVSAISRVGFSTVWVGAFCYSHHQLLNLREVN